jgi:hypothetical protein
VEVRSSGGGSVCGNPGHSELSIAAGETTEFCLNGCFITLPNGDLEALTGAETVVISNGTATIK